VRQVNQARLFGVLGDPVDHSLSPVMHNAAFAALGLPHLYLRYCVPVAALAAALAEARRLGVGGLNLTVPLKEAVLPLVDRLTPEAAGIGAVNTLVFRRAGRRLELLGDNTDGRGFLRSLPHRHRLQDGHAVLIGAGGSARAVGAALARSGVARVTIANRTLARAEALAERFAAWGGARFAVAPLPALARGDLLGDATLVVNTTSVGLGESAIAGRWGASPSSCLFVDLVYGPRPTPFLRGAARAGRTVLDGAGMLLHQGALAFEAWTQHPAPLGAMTRALGRAGLRLTRPGAPRSVRGRRPPT
jgi:shikimate dehydrogenase